MFKLFKKQLRKIVILLHKTVKRGLLYYLKNSEEKCLYYLKSSEETMVILFFKLLLNCYII